MVAAHVRWEILNDNPAFQEKRPGLDLIKMEGGNVEDSILKSTKQKLMIPDDYPVFDNQLIDYINGVFGNLHQLGLGPAEGYQIEGESETWTQYLGGIKTLNMVKTVVFIRVRLLFDPPATSYAQEALNKTATEAEWRLNVAVENLRIEAEQRAEVFLWIVANHPEILEEA